MQNRRSLPPVDSMDSIKIIYLKDRLNQYTLIHEYRSISRTFCNLKLSSSRKSWKNPQINRPLFRKIKKNPREKFKLFHLAFKLKRKEETLKSLFEYTTAQNKNKKFLIT